MTEWVVVSDDGSESEPLDSRSEAEDRLDDLDGIVDAELQQKETDGGKVEVDSAEVVEMSNGGGNNTDTDDSDDEDESVVEPQPVEDELPESANVDEDPVSWMPDHFVDNIEGVPAVSKKGYAVLTEHYDISVSADAVTTPGETGFEYAEFEATAVTDDGREYSGYGTAHVERGDDKTLLGELAETRAMKRAAAWATGVGMTAIEEMQSSVGGETR